MNTVIALFRGINVGGKNLLPMNDIVAVLNSMGCKSVNTYIQSGNVVFRSKQKPSQAMAKELSTKILASRKFEPKVILLDLADLQDAIEDNPFETNDGKTLHFFFLDSPPKSLNTDRLAAIKVPSEKFHFNGKVFYLYAPDGIGRSKLAAKVEQYLGVPITARNWNTVNKLIDMARQIASNDEH